MKTQDTDVAAKEWRIELPGWLPVSLNRIIGNRWAASRLKKRDARTIEEGCRIHGVPPVGLTRDEKKLRKEYGVPSTSGPDPVPCKRHVMLEIKLGKGERALDEDNYWKSLLDGLKSSGMLFEDSRQWCSHDSEIKFSRGVDRDDRGTVIVIKEQS